MSQSFNQSTSFTLDKAHLVECFEQSANKVELRDYRKAMIIAFLGLMLMFVESEHYYVAYFLIALSFVEFFSIQYRKTWWVWRQLMSKTAHAKVELTINDNGIITKSEKFESQILWQDLISIEQTELGILLKHQNGVNYLSNSYLNDEIIEFIFQHQPSQES